MNAGDALDSTEADDEAYALIADAAYVALKFPDLSARCYRSLARIAAAGDAAAGRPSRPLPLPGACGPDAESRHTELTGPILDLEAMFDEPDDGREWPAGEGA